MWVPLGKVGEVVPDDYWSFFHPLSLLGKEAVNDPQERVRPHGLGLNPEAGLGCNIAVPIHPELFVLVQPPSLDERQMFQDEPAFRGPLIASARCDAASAYSVSFSSVTSSGLLRAPLGPRVLGASCECWVAGVPTPGVSGLGGFGPLRRTESGPGFFPSGIPVKGPATLGGMSTPSTASGAFLSGGPLPTAG